MLEAAFPTFEELRVRSLLFDGDFDGCAWVVYERGAFATDPECGGGVSEDAQAFDTQARQDVRSITEAAASPGRSIREAGADYGLSGSLTEARFSYDPGIDYYDRPGYALPLDVDSLEYEAVDEDWLRRDIDWRWVGRSVRSSPVDHEDGPSQQQSSRRGHLPCKSSQPTGGRA